MVMIRTLQAQHEIFAYTIPCTYNVFLTCNFKVCKLTLYYSWPRNRFWFRIEFQLPWSSYFIDSQHSQSSKPPQFTRKNASDLVRHLVNDSDINLLLPSFHSPKPKQSPGSLTQPSQAVAEIGLINCNVQGLVWFLFSPIIKWEINLDDLWWSWSSTQVFCLILLQFGLHEFIT